MLDESDASASALPAVTSRKVIDKATEGGGRPFNEDPYSFLSPSDEQVQTCLYVDYQFGAWESTV